MYPTSIRMPPQTARPPNVHFIAGEPMESPRMPQAGYQSTNINELVHPTLRTGRPMPRTRMRPQQNQETDSLKVLLSLIILAGSALFVSKLFDHPLAPHGTIIQKIATELPGLAAGIALQAAIFALQGATTKLMDKALSHLHCCERRRLAPGVQRDDENHENNHMVETRPLETTPQRVSLKSKKKSPPSPRGWRFPRAATPRSPKHSKTAFGTVQPRHGTSPSSPIFGFSSDTPRRAAIAQAMADGKAVVFPIPPTTPPRPTSKPNPSFSMPSKRSPPLAGGRVSPILRPAPSIPEVPSTRELVMKRLFEGDTAEEKSTDPKQTSPLSKSPLSRSPKKTSPMERARSSSPHAERHSPISPPKESPVLVQVLVPGALGTDFGQTDSPVKRRNLRTQRPPLPPISSPLERPAGLAHFDQYKALPYKNPTPSKLPRSVTPEAVLEAGPTLGPVTPSRKGATLSFSGPSTPEGFLKSQAKQATLSPSNFPSRAPIGTARTPASTKPLHITQRAVWPGALEARDPAVSAAVPFPTSSPPMKFGKSGRSSPMMFGKPPSATPERTKVDPSQNLFRRKAVSASSSPSGSRPAGPAAAAACAPVITPVQMPSVVQRSLSGRLIDGVAAWMPTSFAFGDAPLAPSYDPENPRTPDRPPITSKGSEFALAFRQDASIGARSRPGEELEETDLSNV